MGYTEEELKILKDNNIKDISKISEDKLQSVTNDLVKQYNKNSASVTQLLSDISETISNMIDKYLGIISSAMEKSDEETLIILSSYKNRLEALSEELLSKNLTTEERLNNTREATEIREQMLIIKHDQDKQKLETLKVIGGCIVGITAAIGTTIAVIGSNNSNASSDTIDTSFK